MTGVGKRGPDKVPGNRKPREYSLTQKVAALAPGEWMILPDPNRDMDRKITALRSNSKTFRALNIKALRTTFIEGDRIFPAIKLYRVE